MAEPQASRVATSGTEPAAALEAVVEPVLAGLGLDLYDLELAGRGPTRVLRVRIQREGGVDLDAITAATEALSPVLDHDPAGSSVLRGSYTLEVTSPGLERPLRTLAHFLGARGETVSVKTRTGGDTRRRRGVLLQADESGFDLELDDGGRERVPYDDLVQARTVFEWGAAAEPGRGRTQRVAR